MNYQENYKKARKAGYSDEEIIDFLSKKDPSFNEKVQKAQEAGYTPDEIKNFFNPLPEQKEDFQKSSFRTALQIPQGVLSTTGPGLASGLWEALSHGEIFDPEEIEHIKKISEREGLEFDEEAYKKAAENALGTIPTVTNIAKKVEEKTGIPLEPKTRVQKGLRFATEATRLSPSPGTFRGMNTSLPKPVLGAGVEGVNELLQQAGVPEPLSNLFSFGILKKPPEGAPSLEFPKIEKSTKSSGLTKRRFENLKEPRAISSGKLEKINKKVESDFREISDRIIKDSPVGETFNNLKNDPTFKQQSRELLNQAQQIADATPGSLSTGILKEEISSLGSKNIKGYALGEYDKNYIRFINDEIKSIVPEKATFGELVEQYRKNNSSLSEYFEPGSSKALNRAKRDAILDHNRAIANVMEKGNPELSKVFKEGNDRWTRIMDVEAVDDFVKDIFSGDRISYKKVHDFFDKAGNDRIFKRALGDKGFKEFETLMKDLIESEVPYGMLNIARKQGFEDLVKTAGAFVLHPTIGKAKLGYEAARRTYKTLINSLLDKPELTFKFKHAVDDLKKGKFAAAEKEFNDLQSEIKLLPQEEKPTIKRI